MAIKRQDTLHLAGAITGATGAVVRPAANEGERPFTVVRNGAGDYTVTMAADHTLTVTSRGYCFTAIHAAACIVQVAAATETATVFQILAFDAAGMGLDPTTLYFEVHRIAP